MNATINQLPKAQLEILEAWEWYEDKQTGLGDRFIYEIYKKIKSIEANPLHYALKEKYREAKADVFPFLIIYTFNKNENLVVIVSVFHMSRHPKGK